MSTNSVNLNLSYLAAAQAQKHVTVNEALRIIDAAMFLTVIDRNLTTPPSTPTEGDRYIIPSGASGAWTIKTNQIAVWVDSAWLFLTPHSGWRAWVEDEGCEVRFNGTAWGVLVSTAHGASTALKILEEEVTVSGANTNTSIQIPDRAVVIGVSTRTTVSISGATSYDCGISGDASKFGGSLGIAAGSTNAGVIGPTAFYAATPVRLTANGSNFTGGKVRVAIHFLEVVAPAS